MAKAFKRGDKWRIQPSKTLHDGTRVRTSITAESKKEAERLAALWEVEIESTNKKPQLKTVEECLDKYFETCKSQNLSPSYLRWQKAKKSAYKSIKNIKIKDLTIQDIQNFVNQRCTEVTPSVIRSECILLKCVISSYAPHIDFKLLKLPKIKKAKKKEFKSSWKNDVPSKIVELYGKCDMYLYVLLIIYAGLRPSESHALRFCDISKEPIIENIDGKEIKIGQISITKAIVQDENDKYQEKSPKSEAGYRTIDVSWHLIEQILEVSPRTNDNDKIIKTGPRFKKRWKRIKKELGLPDDLRVYDLRHYFATSKVLAGATEEELQSDMGHSNSAFTHRVYVEIMEDHKQKVNRNFVLESEGSLSELKDIKQKKG